MVSVVASSLQSVGISEARGAQLLSLREQNDATLKRNATASATNSEANPDTIDRTRGTGTGGVTSDRIGFSRELSTEQRKLVERLRQIDAQVREHESAHLRNGSGVVTSGANFSYTYGPDGKAYAVGGEVGIDTSPERQAEANIDKGRAIQTAALAPRDPSPQDFRVAAVGGQLESRGRSDLAEQMALERAESAVKNRNQRESQQQERVSRTEAVAVQAQNTGESQNIEMRSSATESVIARQRAVNAYQTVPKDVASRVSLFA
jgi:hypothetical protein